MEQASRGDADRANRSARDRGLKGWPTRLETAYLLAVGGLATWGFASGSTATILLTVLLALPAGPAALVGFYLAYGVLALVPGANPDANSGSATCSPGGPCQVSSTGDLATWFALSTDVIAVLLLTAAAVVNVALLRFVISRRRASSHPRSIPDLTHSHTAIRAGEDAR
jgi:hypothetical protein